jgi:hypothetical protein
LIGKFPVLLEQPLHALGDLGVSSAARLTTFCASLIGSASMKRHGNQENDQKARA